jgi:hypothetical protein
MRRINIILTVAAVALSSATSFAAATSGFGLNVLVNGSERPEYHGRGNVYVEAIRGSDYAIRLTNPMSYRVAVALSVDGLNTIDARHTAARDAAKWVLDPYESTVISGWQVNQRAARRFYFTGESDSYGAAIGQTENLGIIEAVFYRERFSEVDAYRELERRKSEAEGAARNGAAPAPAAAPKAQASLSDDYAGTGMGTKTQHAVRTVDIELNPHPVASVRIRYEFHPQLVKLGILPQFASPSPLERREHARGFEGYCPEP